MKKQSKKKKDPTIEEIEAMADKGEEVAQFFSSPKKREGFKEIQLQSEIKRVVVDFPLTMIEELDKTAQDLYVSRQAVSKSLVRMGLNEGMLNKKEKKSS